MLLFLVLILFSGRRHLNRGASLLRVQRPLQRMLATAPSYVSVSVSNVTYRCTQQLVKRSHGVALSTEGEHRRYCTRGALKEALRKQTASCEPIKLSLFSLLWRHRHNVRPKHSLALDPGITGTK